MTDWVDHDVYHQPPESEPGGLAQSGSIPHRHIWGYWTRFPRDSGICQFRVPHCDAFPEDELTCQHAHMDIAAALMHTQECLYVSTTVHQPPKSHECFNRWRFKQRCAIVGDWRHCEDIPTELYWTHDSGEKPKVPFRWDPHV